MEGTKKPTIKAEETTQEIPTKKTETNPSDIQENRERRWEWAALGYPPIGWEEGWDMSKGMPATVDLRFAHSKSPVLMIYNNGVSVAREIKWRVFLWNMDLPDRIDPLPIPEQTFNWIKGGGSGGPVNIFNTPLVSPLLKSGNRLIGYAWVDCPACARRHNYVIYIVWGESGWIATIEHKKSHGDLIIPKDISKDGLEKYLNDIESLIPIDARLPIRDY